MHGIKKPNVYFNDQLLTSGSTELKISNDEEWRIKLQR